MKVTAENPQPAPGPPSHRLSRWMTGWGELLKARLKGEITTASFDDTMQRLGNLPFGEEALQVLEGALRIPQSEPTSVKETPDGDARMAERVAKDLGWH